MNLILVRNGEAEKELEGERKRQRKVGGEPFHNSQFLK